MAARARRQPAPAPAPVVIPAAPMVGAYTIDDLRPFRCRFICSAERSPVRYCGRPTIPSASNKHGSWCDAHQAVVFTPKPVIAARKAGRG